MENFDLEFNIEEVEQEIVLEDDGKQLDPTRLSKSRRSWCC